MSGFASVAKDCFSEANAIFQDVRSNFANWDDEKADEVKAFVDNSSRGFKSAYEAAKAVEYNIARMQEIEIRINELSRKAGGY